jgi:hypothetical protein
VKWQIDGKIKEGENQSSIEVELSSGETHDVSAETSQGGLTRPKFIPSLK